MPPLAHRLAVDLFKARLVYEDAPDIVLRDHAGALAVEFEHVAILDQDDLFVGDVHVIFEKLFVPVEHPVFAVDGDDELGAHRFGHDAYVFLRSVAADVDQAALLVNDLAAAFVDVADEPRDGALVARYDARR